MEDYGYMHRGERRESVYNEVVYSRVIAVVTAEMVRRAVSDCVVALI